MGERIGRGRVRCPVRFEESRRGQREAVAVAAAGMVAGRAVV